MQTVSFLVLNVLKTVTFLLKTVIYTTRVMKGMPLYHPGYERDAPIPPGYVRDWAIHHPGM